MIGISLFLKVLCTSLPPESLQKHLCGLPKKHICSPKYIFFCFSRAPPTAYGGSQARDLIGSVATSLHHSHSNAGSKPHLQPTPQLRQRRILNPLREARDRTYNLMVPSQIRFHCTATGMLFVVVVLMATPVAYGCSPG